MKENEVMKALVKTGRGKGLLELRDIPVPDPGSRDALVRVKAAAVCATDVHIANDLFPYTPPMVLGHEFSGIVERIGDQVTGVRPGDAVVSENNPFACGTCRVCALGYPNLCPQKRAMGIHSDGCFAEYVRLPAHLLHPIPAGVSFDEAALAEPLAVAIHAVADRCGVGPGDHVVVMGPGAIGLLAAQVARAEGAGSVTLVGTGRDEPRRLALARDLGVRTAIAETDDIAGHMKAATGGIGADVVIEASGNPRAVALGVELLRRGGRMVVAGIMGRKETAVPWDSMTGKGLSVLFSYGSRARNWDKAMEMMQQRTVLTLPLVTHRMKLERWAHAFELLEKMESVRTVLEVDAS